MDKQAQHDELTDTGVMKLSRAYQAGTERLVAHFESLMQPTPRRDLLTEVL